MYVCGQICVSEEGSVNSGQGQLYAWTNPGCHSVPAGAVRPILFMLRKMARPLNNMSRDPVVPRTASDSVLFQASALLLYHPCGM